MKALRCLLFAVCVLAPRPSHALFCPSAATLEAQLELCDDNEKFAAAAESCRNEYLKAVKAEQDKLGGVLRKGAGGAGSQSSAQGISAASYDATIARLDQLILRGVATRAEQIGYLSHFLPPFRWPAELGPLPKADDPELWKAYDGEYCFGEHRETIDHMVKDVDQAVADLRKARGQAAELRAGSSAHKQQLGTGAAKAVTGGKGESGQGAGPQAPAGQSDITGVEQDKAKQPK